MSLKRGESIISFLLKWIIIILIFVLVKWSGRNCFFTQQIVLRVRHINISTLRVERSFVIHISNWHISSCDQPHKQSHLRRNFCKYNRCSLELGKTNVCHTRIQISLISFIFLNMVTWWGTTTASNIGNNNNNTLVEMCAHMKELYRLNQALHETIMTFQEWHHEDNLVKHDVLDP